ncbi:hypothetical protein [Pseudomonas sp. BP8]|uniref:hypothetical protein n=1 Tax=Pseudomonas sp. BP8 TaxID=2817864 RepID=UPI001AE7F082|nr:hypothetical protein [Pseudomonas sp. BP8]MBP2263050.1 hypothetical protein [Pseudomonas sp. BP8]HDS1736879.1 hypothetical protein [Pseudomonas putida]
MATTAFASLVAAITLEYSNPPVPFAALQQMPYFAALAVWATFAIFAAGIPLLVKSTRAQLLGFAIATIGAVVICLSSASGALVAKRELANLQERIAEIKIQVSAPRLTAEQRQDLNQQRFTLEDDAQQQEIKIDLAGVMTNFAAMTLGGFGAGLLTAVATSTRTREEDEQLEAPVFSKILHALHYVFAWVAVSSIFTEVALIHAARMSWISTEPYQSGYLVSCWSLAVALVLAGAGFCLAHVQSKPKAKPLLSVIVCVVVAYIYVKGLSLAAGFLGGWILLNVPLLLVFSGVRQRLHWRRSAA